MNGVNNSILTLLKNQSKMRSITNKSNSIKKSQITKNKRSFSVSNFTLIEKWHPKKKNWNIYFIQIKHSS